MKSFPVQLYHEKEDNGDEDDKRFFLQYYPGKVIKTVTYALIDIPSNSFTDDVNVIRFLVKHYDEKDKTRYRVRQ